MKNCRERELMSYHNVVLLPCLALRLRNDSPVLEQMDSQGSVEEVLPWLKLPKEE